MSKKFLKFNPIDQRWKVVDKDDFPFGDGKTPKEAIESARLITSEVIFTDESCTEIAKI